MGVLDSGVRVRVTKQQQILTIVCSRANVISYQAGGEMREKEKRKVWA